MAITEQEEELFAKWAQGDSRFVKDGVIDEASYAASNIKILLILKEVNDLGGGGWDLRQLVKEGTRAQTWSNVTRWVKGIRQLPKEIPWESLKDISQEDRQSILASIAVMNLKKIPGNHTADMGAVAAEAHTNRNKEYLLKQFHLYDADLVICGGTSNIFHDVTGIDKTGEGGEWKQTYRGVWYHEYRPHKYIINYAHPEARCADALLYYGLMDAIKEIMSLQPEAATA